MVEFQGNTLLILVIEDQKHVLYLFNSFSGFLFLINIVNKNSLEEFKEVYNRYQKGDYNFGKYETENDLTRAFYEGKTFVLYGSNNFF